MSSESSFRRPSGTWRDEIILSLFVVATIALPAVFSNASSSNVGDPDVWWHLRTGEWIVAQRAVPYADPFSVHGQDATFVAYSWLAELLLYGLYQVFGLQAFGLYTLVLMLAIGVSLVRLLRGSGADVAPACAYALVALLGLTICATPRPWLFTILFFIWELDLILSSGRTGGRWRLLWLPVILCLWANLHIQFVGGLLVLAAATVESFVASRWKFSFVSREASAVPWPWLLAILVLSTAATFVTPYGYHLYAAGALLMGQQKLWNYIGELQAPAFRQLSHWALLAMSLGAAYAVGRRKQIRPLLVLLLVGGCYCGFRSQRDIWIPLVVSAVILAETFPRFSTEAVSTRARAGVVGAILVGLVLGLIAFPLHSTAGLQTMVEEIYPAKAVAYIREHGLRGPMFNTYGWGGYLIENLPEVPVSMDGRSMIYTQDGILDRCNTMCGHEGWDEDQGLEKARLILIPADSTLARLLPCDGRFVLLYKDKVAVVYGTLTEHRLAAD